MPNDDPSTVLFIPHGGGPLPLLGDPRHRDLISCLQRLPSTIKKPSAILVISAHWEEQVATITSNISPPLIYDYFGFPDEAYKIQYPAAGDPVLANKIAGLLTQHGIKANLDEQRGFDHGMFVPLKIIYPDAQIPCVQLSLVKGLDPQTHIDIGKALANLRNDNVLILGSGFSFHNLRELLSQTANIDDEKNKAFENWLIETCTDENLSSHEREQRLIKWAEAPFARYCHPRVEHLLPLHICYGCCETKSSLVFNEKILGKKASAYLW